MLVKFLREERNKGFFSDAKKEVDDYFKLNAIPVYGNNIVYIKGIICCLFLFSPIVLVIFGAILQLWLLFFMYACMGLGIVGVGCCVHHDANHDCLHKNNKINRIVSIMSNLFGVFHKTWRIQHNFLHHNYTNIESVDEDIDVGFLMRFSPNSRHYKFHRYQHIYGWILYCFLTLQMVTYKDFKLIATFNKKDLLKIGKLKKTTAYAELILYKILYVSIFIFLPTYCTDFSLLNILSAFFLMHMISGLCLALIFQLTHIMPETQFPKISNGSVSQTWGEHQLLNACNHSNNNVLLFHVTGGLNYAIEHHLFPGISHIHYPQIAPIIERVARKHNLQYNKQQNFFFALREHYFFIKKLGNNP